LLIDDIQFIEKKDRTEEEIFHTFNTLYEDNRRIILSSDRPPKDLISLSERLRSRFACGLVADIQPPEYETRVAILINKAELENLEINDDLLSVIRLIAERIHANIRELEGAFIRVVAHGKLISRKIDEKLTREVLPDVFYTNENDITLELIKKCVCRHFSIKLSEMDSSNRERSFSRPRQIAMYLCRKLTNVSLEKIKISFKKGDHTTVLYACDKIKKERKANKELDELLSSLENEIRNN
jgi:chromosomal replication initiator protein